MRLETSGATVSKNADENAIAGALRGLKNADDTAILSRTEMTYIQAAGSAAGGFALEYQDGDLGAHFLAGGSAIPVEVVISAFCSYLRGEDAWKSAYSWEKLEL